MREKTYRAKTMKEALRGCAGTWAAMPSSSPRARFGADDSLGLGPREVVEVTASATMPAGSTVALESIDRNHAWRALRARRCPPAAQAQFGEEAQPVARDGRDLEPTGTDRPPAARSAGRAGSRHMPCWSRPSSRGAGAAAGAVCQPITWNPISSAIRRPSRPRSARRSSSAFRSRRRSGPSWEPGGWSPWSDRPASERRPPSPSSQPISS